MQKRSTRQAVDRLFTPPEHQSGLPEIPDLKPGFRSVVSNIYDSALDPVTEYETIEESLSIKDALTPTRLSEAGNQAEAMARRAFRLFLIGKAEVDAYMRETEAIVGAIRDRAVAALEKEKADKIRTKQITDADVTAKCAQLYPEEWSRINARRERAKGMVKDLENLHEMATSRCRTVARMMNPSGRL